MVHVPAVETVEVVETETVRPTVEGAGGARLPGGRVVILPDPRRHVSILPQHFADGAAASRQHAGVAFVTRRGLRDAGEGCGMVIAPRDERRSRRAAQRGGVEAIEANPFFREPVHGRRWNTTTEGAELTKTGVVDQDEHHVGRTLRRLYRLRKLRWIGIEIGSSDGSLKMKVRRWKHGRRAAGGSRVWRDSRDSERGYNEQQSAIHVLIP